MQVYEAVRTILAVRAYQDKPIPKETIQRILEAGRLTGSSMNGQPWHLMSGYLAWRQFYLVPAHLKIAFGKMPS